MDIFVPHTVHNSEPCFISSDSSTHFMFLTLSIITLNWGTGVRGLTRGMMTLPKITKIL